MIPIDFTCGRGGAVPVPKMGTFDPRCEGIRCPSSKQCDRHTNTDRLGTYAPLWFRREAGDSACKLFVANRPMSTFDGVHRD